MGLKLLYPRGDMNKIATPLVNYDRRNAGIYNDPEDAHKAYLRTLELLQKRTSELIDEIKKYMAHPMDLHNRTLSGTPARMWAWESLGVRTRVTELRNAMKMFDQNHENVQDALFKAEE